ncbi:hypothetical protein RA2_01927 [Roseovarius sp. A-2]|uniref:hypothetical protein n=1 Tax=Roseovarius sp. A-2 TaxID=1570360 RepID=UPI0009B58C58|nr:hypothetical protein [Roseovarius sp. A-2]GAW34874.1 hypothetical protein RA2_01927 [Roseovarius sp. A-2]
MRVKIGRADVTKANEARAIARDILLPEIQRGVDPRARYNDDDRDATYGQIMRGIRMSNEKAALALRGRHRRDVENTAIGHLWAMYEDYHPARPIEDQGSERANWAKKHIAVQRRVLGGAEKYIKDAPPASAGSFNPESHQPRR